MFFGYATVLACWLPISTRTAALAIAANIAAIAGCFILSWGETLPHRRFFSILRDWYPVPFVLFAYWEMGWFAPATHSYSLERAWIVWDKILLYRTGFKAFIEMTAPIGPAVLEVAYLLYYALPVSAVALFYLCRRRERVDRFLFQLLTAVFLAYALFPLFPSEPPRTVFPGEDLPAQVTLFRDVNLWILGDWGIHTSVFPSVHVTVAFSAAFGAMRLLRERRWIGRGLLLLAVLIALATIYGRYHYAVDAVAGLATALIAWFATRAIDRRSGL